MACDTWSAGNLVKSRLRDDIGIRLRIYHKKLLHAVVIFFDSGMLYGWPYAKSASHNRLPALYAFYS